MNKCLYTPKNLTNVFHRFVVLACCIITASCIGAGTSSSSSVISVSSSSSSSAVPLTSAQLWQQQCQTCHGPIGEGNGAGNFRLNLAEISRTYPTLAELSEYISSYMPKGNEGLCAGECADKMAGYVNQLIETYAIFEPPSCAQGGVGLNTCGVSGKESCCTSLPVEGGTFYRTYSNFGSGPYGQRDQATVSTFKLDKYELTVARFRQYVNYLVDGGSRPTPGSGKHAHLNNGKGVSDSANAGSYEQGWSSAWDRYIPAGPGAAATWVQNLNCSSYNTWTQNPGSNEALPLTCMNWYEAYAFCAWDGGFLPTEAEWKYAVAGGDEQRRYAWGSASPGTKSEYAMYDCYYPDGNRGNCTSVGKNIAPVGNTPKGVGRWGQYDLAGSVWEWNLDVYGNYTAQCKDCARLSGGSQRVLPGAGFHTPPEPYLYAYNRTSVNYDTTYRGDYGVGVRCARVPD